MPQPRLQFSEDTFRALVEQSIVGCYLIRDGRYVVTVPRGSSRIVVSGLPALAAGQVLPSATIDAEAGQSQVVDLDVRGPAR